MGLLLSAWSPETSRSDKSSSQAEPLDPEPSKAGQIVGSFFGEIFLQLWPLSLCAAWQSVRCAKPRPEAGPRSTSQRVRATSRAWRRCSAPAPRRRGGWVCSSSCNGHGGEGEGHKRRPAPKAAASSTEWQNRVRERTSASVRCFNLKVPLLHPKVPPLSQALKKESSKM